MATASATQDMPPKGGYAPIVFKRIPAKVMFKGWQWIAGMLVIKFAAAYRFIQLTHQIQAKTVENRSAKLAITPLLYAERERMMLLKLMKNREEEERLMADVPGWEVGTYYGEPKYKTLPKNRWVNPSPYEYFMHNSHHDYLHRVYFSRYAS